MILALLLACDPPPPPGELIFVRGGIIAPAGEGTPLADGRVYQDRAWTPGETVEIGGITGTAPVLAECAPLYQVTLGDVSRLIAMGGEAPDTALRWSPDGRWLGVGTYDGELIVVDGWTGAVRARRKLTETLVKQVAWSPDSQTLYAAEQSPDALLYAMDPATLQPRWTYALSQEVERSTPPAGEDLYGVYSLPGAYGLVVLPSGELLVAASHGWNRADGVRVNRARLLRLSPEGAVRGTFPADGPADAIFVEPRVSGDRLVLPINRSADGPPPSLPVGGVQILSLPDLQPVTSVTPEPLTPWFKTTFLWEAVALDEARLMLGLGDGRVQLIPLDGGETRTLTPGTPILHGEVPIAASVGFGLLHEGDAVFITSNTNIPYGAATPDLRPPAAHPGENTLWVVGADGTPRWTWRGEQRLNGLSLGGDGHSLVVGAGHRPSDERADLYGALIFDLDAPGASGADHLRAVCNTASPVFFRQALAADGRLAVAEVPTQGADGGSVGRWQVTVFR